MRDRPKTSSSGIVIHGHLTRNRSGRSARAGLMLNVYIDGEPKAWFAPSFPYWRHAVPFLSKGQPLRLPPGAHTIEVRQETDRGTQVVVSEAVFLDEAAWIDVHCKTASGKRITVDDPLVRLEVIT